MHIMVDLETTGVEPGCCILSIALVPFDLGLELTPFYDKISHRLSRDYGFVDDPDTLNWWDKQKPEISDEAFSGDRSPEAVLESVSYYLKQMGEPKQLYLWGNGKDFDNVILTKAFKKLGKKLPWHYGNNWCYRDFTKLYPMIPKLSNPNAHNALADAQAQASHLELIFDSIRRGKAATLPGA
jgi:hypothetical protein